MNDGFESGDSESTDDSVNTAELPELIEIENPDEPKPQEKEPEETNDDTPTIPGLFKWWGCEIKIIIQNGKTFLVLEDYI